MSSSRLLRSSLVLGVASFLGLLVHGSLHSVNYAEEAAYSRDVRRLQGVNAELNERVLKSRSGLASQYDPLIAAHRELLRLHVALKNVPAFLGSDAALELRERLDASEAELRQKIELIETFKTHNAVVQNSLHYFPVLANTLIERVRSLPEGADLAARVQSLIGAIMLFDTATDIESTSRVLRAQVDVQEHASLAKELGVDREVELVLAHANVILERKPLVDGAVRQILGVSLPRSALRIEDAYSFHYRAAMDRALVERQILFGLALAVVVLGLTEVILRIRRSAIALELATTELRSANLALTKEREKERQLGEMKTRFVAMTSHEFRNPLTAIVSSAELLESYGDRWVPEHRAEHLERIRAAAGDMERMLDDILTIGKAEAGVLRPSPVPLRLDQFCEQLVATLEHSSAREHSIRLHFDGDPEASLDERLLRQVLGNLLGNALKYSPPGSEVSFDVKANGGPYRFSIGDQGIGIPPEALPHLYESFYRGSNADPIKGTGLGLAVVKKALDVQNGSIVVESQLGRGTKFQVTIPRETRRSLPANCEA